MSKLVSRDVDILGVPIDSLKWNYKKLVTSPMYYDHFLTWVRDEGMEDEPERFQQYAEDVIFDSAFEDDSCLRLHVGGGDIVTLDCLKDGGLHQYIGLAVPSQWYDKPSFLEDAKEGIAHTLSQYCDNKESDIEKICQRRQDSWTELW